MRRRTALQQAALLATLVVALLVLPVSAASAHPLGNFTINHYNGLLLAPDHIDDSAVIDFAELPTVQLRDDLNTNGDDSVSVDEQAAFAATECRALATQLKLTVNDVAVAWDVRNASFGFGDGVGALRVSRLECDLTVKADLSQPTRVQFTDAYLSDRLGWREITAEGDGIALTDPPVPAVSVSDELRNYPNGLLSSPLNERQVELAAAPGKSTVGGQLPTVTEPGGATRVLEGVSAKLQELVGDRDLTVGVGLLAVLLALVLGASHAALPGHGKTIMAAYMVGTRGTPKDAVLIGATVTLSHTTGVLILGALFSAGAAFAGDRLLAILGVISGLLVVAVGAGLLWSAVHRKSNGLLAHGHGHGHGHDHGHGLEHEHGHGHASDGSHEHGDGHGHSHGDEHGHRHGDHASPQGLGVPVHANQAQPGGVAVLASAQHVTDTGSTSSEQEADRGFRRLTLAGLGLAGGLVPSPTAILVLLGCISLGRTAFGAVLVLVYGIGMAATLIAVGYLIARLPRRLSRLRAMAQRPWLAWFTKAAPTITAALVLIVGIGLTLRSAVPLV